MGMDANMSSSTILKMPAGALRIICVTYNYATIPTFWLASTLRQLNIFA